MKVAILFYGFARCFNLLSDAYKKHMLPDADIFIQTHSRSYEETDPKRAKIIYDVDINTFKNTFGDRIKYFANPKYDDSKFRNYVESNNIYKINSVRQQTHRIASMMYNIKQVIDAKSKFEADNNFKYDIVVLTRLDLKFYSNLTLPKCTNKLTHPAGTGFLPNGKRKFGSACIFGTDQFLNDQIVIANTDIINLLGLIYDNIPKFHEKNVMINGETLFGWQMINSNIKFSPEDIATYEIHRAQSILS